jgi:hypothetical protein
VGEGEGEGAGKVAPHAIASIITHTARQRHSIPDKKKKRKKKKKKKPCQGSSDAILVVQVLDPLVVPPPQVDKPAVSPDKQRTKKPARDANHRKRCAGKQNLA